MLSKEEGGGEGLIKKSSGVLFPFLRQERSLEVGRKGSGQFLQGFREPGSHKHRSLLKMSFRNWVKGGLRTAARPGRRERVLLSPEGRKLCHHGSPVGDRPRFSIERKDGEC